MKNAIKWVAALSSLIVASAAPALAGVFPPVPAPEPTSIALLVGGLGSVIGLRYYLRRK
jgi:hypothetical protein